MPPITVIAATPQLAEKADDLVLTNVEIGNDGEVSCEVANTRNKQSVTSSYRSFICGVGRMNFTPAKMIPEEQCM
ncbi:MAG TPA: hypothetical protein VF089_01500 [Candidatus Binatia bacterium]